MMDGATIGHNGGPTLDDISEAASEKKRGRPRIGSHMMSTYVWLHPEIKTTRGRQNRHYWHAGIEALGIVYPAGPNLDRFGWLVDWKAGDKHRKGAIKTGIISELGRLSFTHTPETVLAAADAVCRLKPTVKGGIALIRRWRLGRSARVDPDTLLSRLCVVVDQYRVEHPDVGAEKILDDINDLYRAVQEVGERGDA